MSKPTSNASDPATTDSSAARLTSFIERIERLEEEKKAIADDIKDVFAEAKGTGFDVAIMKSILKLRKMETGDRQEYFELLDLYMRALGMLSGTPLGDAAMRSAGVEPPAVATEKPKPPKVDEALEEKNRLAKLSAKEAEAMGRTAHKAGKPITANPFAPRSKQRGAWDNGWCAADGSDGMALPGSSKPSSPKGDDAGAPSAQ